MGGVGISRVEWELAREMKKKAWLDLQQMQGKCVMIGEYDRSGRAYTNTSVCMIGESTGPPLRLL